MIKVLIVSFMVIVYKSNINELENEVLNNCLNVNNLKYHMPKKFINKQYLYRYTFDQAEDALNQLTRILNILFKQQLPYITYEICFYFLQNNRIEDIFIVDEKVLRNIEFLNYILEKKFSFLCNEDKKYYTLLQNYKPFANGGFGKIFLYKNIAIKQININYKELDLKTRDFLYNELSFMIENQNNYDMSHLIGKDKQQCLYRVTNGAFIIFMFMEKYQGDLYKTKSKYNFASQLDIIFKMSVPVEKLHLKKYGHFDIKQENYFQKDYYTYVLGDFGMTRKFQKKIVTESGTPIFLPIQFLKLKIRDKMLLSPIMDVFAFITLIYQELIDKKCESELTQIQLLKQENIIVDKQINFYSNDQKTFEQYQLQKMIIQLIQKYFKIVQRRILFNEKRQQGNTLFEELIIDFLRIIQELWLLKPDLIKYQEEEENFYRSQNTDYYDFQIELLQMRKKLYENPSKDLLYDYIQTSSQFQYRRLEENQNGQNSRIKKEIL